MPQVATAEIMEDKEGPTQLMPDGDPSIKLNPNAVSPRRFVDYAASLAKSHNCALTCQFLSLRRTETEKQTLEALTFLLSANNAFGIYSESPFLRPVTLLRPVQFAFPAKVVSQHPDPENMVRRLRDLADQKVTSLPLLAILSGAKPNSASLGFYTDYLTYSFTLKLDINTMRLLMDQSRQLNVRADKYRLILRLAWATTGLYMPSEKSNPSRVLASEMLPRCLSVRVARRNVTLPDPTFHEGQAQNFGHRLRFAIDITDKIPVRWISLVSDLSIEIDLTWLHAPLEDHALPLLEMVGSGSCTPILNELLNLPLIQVTLDRVQPIPEFVDRFSSAVAGKPVTDTPPGCKPPHLPFETPEALVGVYDFCRSPDRVIAASETLAMVKAKLTLEDDLQSDGWIPVSLLCPLTLTRIEIPVRSVNCDHLQCFDLSSYLTINKKRPRWSCPVCSSSAPFRDLRRDECCPVMAPFAVERKGEACHEETSESFNLPPAVWRLGRIIQSFHSAQRHRTNLSRQPYLRLVPVCFFVQLIVDQSLKEAEMVHVDVNGQWRDVSKPVENDASAVISIKESISVMPSVNPVVPSLLNGTSTMTSCAVESNSSSKPVTPVGPDASHFSDDFILPLGENVQEEGSATQPEQPPTITHSMSSSNGFRGQPLPAAAVTDEQSGKLSFATLHCAPRTLTPPARKKKRKQRQLQVEQTSEEIIALINSDKMVAYCQESGLLPYVHKCHFCRRNMNQQRLAEQSEGFAFHCGRCKITRTIRSGSVFENSHLPIRQILKIWLSFVRSIPVSAAVQDLGVSRAAAVSWYAFCRGVCASVFLSAEVGLGGPGVEVQVHETLITRRRSRTERRKVWLLGMYDTTTRKAIFEHVDSRSWSALGPVLTKWINKGSVVITSDECEAYQRLPLEGYTHCPVSLSSQQVKDTTTGKPPTNEVEAYWRRLKRRLHRGGQVRGRAILEHISEVQYRLWYGLYSMGLMDAWNLFLSHVAQVYPVNPAV